jgi:hypothetical protein
MVYQIQRCPNCRCRIEFWSTSQKQQEAIFNNAIQLVFLNLFASWKTINPKLADKGCLQTEEGQVFEI